MSKSITMSFSVSVELSIKMEEQMENERISRSTLLKKALEEYFLLQESNKESIKLVREIYKIVEESRDLLKG